MLSLNSIAYLDGLERMFNNGHWRWPHGQMDETGCEGFIYLVRDPMNATYYIGKKSYRTKAGPVSNWRNYMTSAKGVKAMMQEMDILELLVLEEYKTKGCLSWSETWSLATVLAAENARCLNVRIEKVSWPVNKERISDRHKERLQAAVSWKDFNNEGEII